MDYFEVYHSNGRQKGQLVERARIHSTGLWHKTVHVWFYNRKGKILFQKRAKTKDSHPGLWDVSVAGHIEPGEKPLQAAVREIEEELGIEVQERELNYRERRNFTLISQNGTFIDNEITYIYTYEWNGSKKHITPQPEEVEEIRFIHINRLKTLLNNPAKRKHFVAHENKYYFWIMNIVKDILSRNNAH